MNMQALKSQFDRDLQSKEEQGEEKRRHVVKQLRDIEAELDEERKQRAASVALRKKLEGDLKDSEAQLEMHIKVKEDALKQLKKLQNQLKEYSKEAEEARIVKEEATALAKEAERKFKSLETEYSQITEEYSSACRSKRAIENEREELLSNLTEHANKGLFNIVQNQCKISVNL